MFEYAFFLSVAVPFLLDRLVDKIKSIDKNSSEFRALENSIQEAITKHEINNPTLQLLLHHQKFLTDVFLPEVVNLVSRTGNDIDIIRIKKGALTVTKNLPDDFEENLIALIKNIELNLKQNKLLQAYINNRQIEQTSKDVHELKINQAQNFEKVLISQDTQSELIRGVSQQLESFKSELLTSTLPESSDLKDYLNEDIDSAKADIISKRTENAFETLNRIGERVAKSGDSFTRFRWHTNIGTCWLAREELDKSADEYILAFSFAPENSIAVTNRVRAYLIQGRYPEALEFASSAIEKFNENVDIWTIYLAALGFNNQTVDINQIPLILQSEVSILTMVADLRRKEGALQDSVRISQQACLQDTNNFDAKRQYLCNTLNYAISESGLAYKGLTSNSKVESVIDAVRQFQNVQEYLSDIQSKTAFIEVTHNLLVAYDFISKKQQLTELTTLAYDRFPEEPAFIAYKILQLTELNSEDLKNLFVQSQNAMTDMLRWSFAGSFAVIGDVDSLALCFNSETVEGFDEQEKIDFIGVNLEAFNKPDLHDELKGFIHHHYDTILKSPRLSAFCLFKLKIHNLELNSTELQKAIPESPDDLSTLDKIQIAEYLFEEKSYFKAANYFQSFINFPRNNALTRKYINSLIACNRRSKAIEIISRLNPEDRESTEILELQFNLALSTSDTKNQLSNSEKLIQRMPDNVSVIIARLSVLRRLDMSTEIRSLLSSLQTADQSDAAIVFEIAKFEVNYGYERNALLRMYRLFRNHPNDPLIAGYYFIVFLQNQDSSIFEESSDAVIPGVVVRLQTGINIHKWIIEPSGFKEQPVLTEVMHSDHPLYHGVINKTIDQIVDTQLPYEGSIKIVGIDNLFLFIALKAQEVIQRHPNHNGPLYSIPMEDYEGEFSTTQLKSMLRDKSNRITNLFNSYLHNPLPLDLLAQGLSLSTIKLQRSWPYLEYPMFTGEGDQDSRTEALSIVQKWETVVFDISSIIELHTIGLLEPALKAFNHSFIPISTLEQLESYCLTLNNEQSTMAVSLVEGNLFTQEITNEELNIEKQQIEEIISIIKLYAEVIPVFGPTESTSAINAFSNILSFSAKDTIFLTLERNALLISNDLKFRTLTTHASQITSVWLQPVLFHLLQENLIDSLSYAKSIMSMMQRNQQFVSISAMDLYMLSSTNTKIIIEILRDVAKYFKSSNVEIRSSIKVFSAFIYLIAPDISHRQLAKICRFLLETVDAIDTQFRNTAIQAFSEVLIARKQLLSTKAWKYIESNCAFDVYSCLREKKTELNTNKLTMAIRLSNINSHS